jgi:predicted alpha/beta-fold hydrolase
MIPERTVAAWALAPSVRREILPTGGHVGFVSRSQAPGWFWAPERALAFLENEAGSS